MRGLFRARPVKLRTRGAIVNRFTLSSEWRSIPANPGVKPSRSVRESAKVGASRSARQPLGCGFEDPSPGWLIAVQSRREQSGGEWLRAFPSPRSPWYGIQNPGCVRAQWRGHERMMSMGCHPPRSPRAPSEVARLGTEAGALSACPCFFRSGNRALYLRCRARRSEAPLPPPIEWNARA